MSNSSLVNYTRILPHCDTPRGDKIRKITIHHMAGNLSVETCAHVLNKSEISANYGIGTDGRVGLYVDETNRAWTSANKNNDNQAITIEVANEGGAPDWHVSDTALAKLIDLCADICKRNGIQSLNYTGDASGNLTRHNMFMATTCPGPYLQSKFQYIAAEVNKRLADANPSPAPTSGKLYRVQVGAFAIRENAEKLKSNLDANGHQTYLVFSRNLYKVQVGAFSVKTYADKLAAQLKAKGYATYITTEAAQAVKVINTKTIEELAKEVLYGAWGDGQDRYDRLTAAGYDYTAVQDRVNELV